MLLVRYQSCHICRALTRVSDLAVIFRPGLISHPTHEMLPSEHALSQRVLEFLIAHQDWFMLDILPPPTRKQRVQPHTTTGIDDDIVLVPSSDEESSGWKLIGRDQPRMPRRKTTVDRSGKSNCSSFWMFFTKHVQIIVVR